MRKEMEEEINEIVRELYQVIKGKDVTNGISVCAGKHPEFAKLKNELFLLRSFTDTLAKGDLSSTINLRGYWPGALKALQSNLRHLAWQTGMVASGDYSQRVDFMGDFSIAFNSMVLGLKDAAENERRYIVELEKQQEIIRESERKYKFIAENTGDVIWLLDTDGIIRYISPSVEKLLGFAAVELEGKNSQQTTLTFLWSAFQKITTDNIQWHSSKVPFIVEEEQLRKDRKVIWLESSISIARDQAGTHIGYIGVTRNISERKRNESLLYQAYERKKRSEFFNKLAVRNDVNDLELQVYSGKNKLHIPKDFSLLFFDVDTIPGVSDTADNRYHKQQLVDFLIDILNKKNNTIAWETDISIVVLSDFASCPNHKERETELAESYVAYIGAYVRNIHVTVGIGNYAEGWSGLANRLNNAKTSVRIGKQVWPERYIYHYENCGIYQVLAPFAVTDGAVDYVHQMIGPLLPHPNLLETLEKILSGLSFKEIGTQLYLHHKTIQLRKQRIEQILNISLDCYETRTALATALQLLKILKLG